MNFTLCNSRRHIHDSRYGCGACGEDSWVCSACGDHMTHGINGGEWRFHRDSNGKIQCFHRGCFGNAGDQKEMYLEEVFNRQVPASLFDQCCHKVSVSDRKKYVGR